MLKQFLVDDKLKKQLHKLQRREKFQTLRIIANISWCVNFLVPFAFLIYAYIVEEDFIFYYGPIGSKNLGLIITIAIGIFVNILIITLVFRTIHRGLCGKELTNRIAETLIINGDILEYGYRVFMVSSPEERLFTKIPLNQMQEIKYNIWTKRLAFTGSMSSLYYYQYVQNAMHGQEEYKIETFYIYDYFKPSLYDYIKGQSIEIKSEERSI